MFFPKKILLLLISIIVTLTVINIVTFYYYGFGTYAYKLFNFDTEKNVPSVFSSLILLTASILLLYISFKSSAFKPKKLFWHALSFIFLFLSMDELLRIHEKVGNYTGNYIKGDGLAHFGWLIPYGIVSVFLIFIFAKSFFKLPLKVKTNMIISGVIFVFGAVGIEMITGFFLDKTKFVTNEELKNSVTVFLLYSLEEILEMLGVTYFIYTLFTCIETIKERAKISV